MSVLVFGGAGFLGSYLVRKLMDEGYEAIALDVAMPDPPMPPLRDVKEKLKFEYCRRGILYGSIQRSEEI